MSGGEKVPRKKRTPGSSISSLRIRDSLEIRNCPRAAEHTHGWQLLEDAEELSVQTGYAEYNIMDAQGHKLLSALLTYDERSCMFACCGCCDPDRAYIPHNKLYPNAPEVSYPRHPLNISGFKVQVYDEFNKDVFKFHRHAHDVKTHKDEVMIVSLPKPKGILLGKVVLPRAKCGDFYEIYNAAGEMIYEMPTRVESGTSGYLFDIIRRPDLSTFDNFEVVAMVYIEGRNVVDVGLTEIKTTPAGDFHIRFREQIPTEEKALLVAAAFYVRIREFSSYIPMVEANAAAAIVVK